MRIALYGGTGMIGSRIALEALSRDHHVTTITRSAHGSAPLGVKARTGDAGNANDVARVAAEHDVVVSAIGPSRTGARHQIFLHALACLAENVGTRRLIVVGGAGSLEIAPGLRLLDSPGFPASKRGEALTHAAALELLKDTSALVDWVYISPAPIIGPGERTGAYRIGMNVPVGDSITAGDYAIAVVDEIEVPRFHRARVNVAH